MGTSQSAVARFEAGDLDVRLSTLERYTHGARGHGWNGGSSMGDREQEWPWLPPPGPGGAGAATGSRAPLRDAGAPAAGPARRPAARPARRPLGHPGLGGAHDARCRGRRSRHAARRLRRGRPGARAHADGRDRADGRAGAGAVPGAGGRRRRSASWPCAPTVPPCRAPGSRCASPATQREAHVRNVAQWAELHAGRAAPLLRARRRRRSAGRAADGRGGRGARALPQRGRGGRATASSTRCPGPTPPCAACPGSGSPPMGFRPLR